MALGPSSTQLAFVVKRNFKCGRQFAIPFRVYFTVNYKLFYVTAPYAASSALEIIQTGIKH